MKFFPTTEKASVNNYPYGRLQCEMNFFVEFNPKKGFRSVRQSVNPKTGRLNAPKASTYSDLVIMYQKENGHIDFHHLSMNGVKELNNVCKMVAENFSLFTPEQINYFYFMAIYFTKVNVYSYATYCGSDAKVVLEVVKPFVTIANQGLKEGINLFASMVIDEAAMEATKVKDYRPFK
jgi:hypothetical protein